MLEPILSDYRRLIFRMSDVHMIENEIHDSSPFKEMHMDELIDSLLHSDRFTDINLPRLAKRFILEEDEQINPYKSILDIQLSEKSAGNEKQIK